MLLAQVGRHDQLRHLAPHRLLAGVAERALRGRVELDHATGVIHRHDTVERGLQRCSVAQLAGLMGFLHAPALEDLTELCADGLERREQLGVRLQRGHAEHLDDADDPAFAAHREAQGGAQPGRPRRGAPGHPDVRGSVDHPRRLPCLPDAPGQPFARAQYRRARGLREGVRAVMGRRPDRDAAQLVRLRDGRLPGGCERPVQSLADRLKGTRARIPGAVGTCDRPRDRVFDPDADCHFLSTHRARHTRRYRSRLLAPTPAT